MSATLARPARAGSIADRFAPHLDFGRSNAGYGLDLFSNAELFSQTDTRPQPVYRLVIQTIAATEDDQFADDPVLLPPVHRQRMRLRIRSTRIGAPLQDRGE